MPEKITVRGIGLTVELLLHRKYGVRGRDLLNEALRINPGLADRGAILPLGTSFLMPDLPAQEVSRVQQRSLFKD